MLLIEKHKKIFLIAITVLCIVAGIASVNRYQPTLFENTVGVLITPIQSVTTYVGRWVSDRLYFFIHLRELRDENERLKTELERRNEEQTELRLLRKENERLSQLVKIDQKYPDYPKVGAEIIGKDRGNWYNIFIINKGKKDGLDKNMAVLGDGGLVGRILESGYNYSKVLSLIDDSSSIAAKSVRTEDLGYVKGGLDGLCRMDYISLEAQIVEGDEIVTSQLSDLYPPGILIGYVKEIKPDANGLTKYAIVEPVVNFKQIETVLVISERFNRTLED